MKANTFFSTSRPVITVAAACMVIAALVLSTACKKEEQKAAGLQQKAGAGEGGYQYKIVLKDMTLNWRPAGNTLQVMVRAKTSGWVGVGFNATEGMKDAWFITGIVKGGVPMVIEQHGNTPTTHLKKSDLGGASTLSGVTGSSKNGMTEIRFTIPLKPADIDKPINTDGDTVLLLAYGADNQITQVHTFRAKLTVNLSTGAYSVLTAE